MLPAAARLHHHVLVLLVDHVIGSVDVENADGAEARGHAAGGRRRVRRHGVEQRLNDGVVGLVHFEVQCRQERILARTQRGGFLLSVSGRERVEGLV